MLQRLLMMLSICAALAVLVVLVVRTQSEPQALQDHMTRMTAIAQLRAANGDADRQVAQARLDLEAESAELADAARALQSAHERLAEHLDELRAVSPGLAGALAGLLQQIEDKQALLVDYGNRVERFAASYAGLLDEAQRLLADPALPSSHPLHAAVRRLIEEITAYSLQSSPTNQEAIERLLTTLGLEAASVPAAKGRLFALGLAATKVVGDRDAVMSRAARLAAIPATASLDQLQQRYIAHYVRAEGDLARYRQVLVIYACALLAVFGFVGWRLRRSYGDLQHLNAGLESAVTSRTAELRKALDDLRLQQTQLIQSEKMAALGQMVAGVAHEINTPLGYARGNVQTVRESLPLIRELLDAEASGDAQRREQARQRWPLDEGFVETELLLGDADHGLGQIAELVLGLKDFSRVDRSLTEHFDLNEGLETALKICQNQLKGRIKVQRDYGELPPVPCAPSQINQVFLNLLTNAAQAIDGEGVVAIRTSVEGDAAVVEIRDSGCGMDADTVAHIFEPFFTTKPVGQGTGLGLSIVFRIVEDHRGRIEVESLPGKGTAFRVRLPLQAGLVAAAAGARPADKLREVAA